MARTSSSERPSVQHAESADGTAIAYRASGSGEPMLLVHGAATSGADWLFALPFLRERFTVVTMDRRGRGGSGDGAGYAIAREAEDIAAVLAAVGGDILVGHSFGALCAIQLAATGRDLRRLVLYEPPIAVRPTVPDRVEKLVARGESESVLAAFLVGAGILEEHVELIRRSRAWPTLVEAVPALPRELRAASRWENPAGPIDAPTLFLRGGDTTSVAYLDTFDALRAAFPDSRLELLPGQTHIAHVMDAERFAGHLIRFCAA